MQTNLTATVDMCHYAFEVLYNHFQETSKSPEKTDPIMPFDPTVSCPMFVTLYKDNNLRGCIGTLSSKNLGEMSYYILSRYLAHTTLSYPLFNDVIPLLL
jgi:AMMECR1 domain-containing protein